MIGEILKRTGIMLIKDADIAGYGPWLKFIWKAHISNWLWRDSQTRRLTRQRHYQEMKMGYLEKYVPFVKSLHAKDNSYDRPAEDEKVYSLWFQGLESAPKVVKRCIESIRKIYGDRYVVLDDLTMRDYIDLPDYIMEKWEKKQIGPANFSDIVRIELLTKYGGFWFDATDYLLRPVPPEIVNSDFFMYVTSPVLYTHMFVQTCFIRAKYGDPLIRMWRDLVFEYWKHEKRSADYFLVHLLFKLLVTHNDEAKRLYEKMPKLYQDNLHDFWYVYGHKPYDAEDYKKLCRETFFQKCSYRKLKHAVWEIQPGSMADYLINGKIDKEKV